MAELILDVIGWNYSDIPDMLANVVSGQAALLQTLSPKDKLKVDRLNDALVQLKSSIELLSKVSNDMSSTAETGSRALTSTFADVQKILGEFEQFCDEHGECLSSHQKKKKSINGVIRTVKQKRDCSLFLDDITERLLHAVKVLRFSISMTGYVQYQKNNSLARMIADPIACDQWIRAFGTSTNAVPFEDILSFLDKYFSEVGRDAQELEASCNSSTFFSWFRHESTWSRCTTCQEALSKALVEDESKAEVKLHAFAGFCGENLLLAIRNLILSAHPRSSKNQIIEADLHLTREDVEEIGEVESPVAPDSEGLEHNQIVFVGQSDHLAELHYSVCRQVMGKTVNRIDSVKDANELLEWLLENESNLKEQKGKTLVVVDCQAELMREHTEEHDCSAAGHHLLADKVCRVLMMRNAYQVGVALLTCPFLIHEAGKVEQFQRKLEKTPFQRQLISSDCRKMGQFIVNMFTSAQTSGSRQEEPVSVPSSKFNEEFSDVADDLAASMAKMKKSNNKKTKSKKHK